MADQPETTGAAVLDHDTRRESDPVPPRVCPFCAELRSDTVGPCPRCTLEDTPGTRRSTGERIGPWFVLQRKNPTAPGLRLVVLQHLARTGHVTPRSVVRGPTTGQFWTYAGQVRGVSRLFGLCWHCGASVTADATSCSRCGSGQEIEGDPDVFIEPPAGATRLPVCREVPPPRPDRTERSDHRDRAGPARRKHAAPNAGLEGAVGEQLLRSLARPAGSSADPETQRSAADAILSARELAAAFQLDTARRHPVSRLARRLFQATLVLLMILGLLIAALAAVLTFSPDLRAKAIDWAGPTLSQWGVRLPGTEPATQPTTQPATPPATPPITGPAADGSDRARSSARAPIDPVAAPFPPDPNPVQSTPDVLAPQIRDALAGGNAPASAATGPAATASPPQTRDGDGGGARDTTDRSGSGHAAPGAQSTAPQVQPSLPPRQVQPLTADQALRRARELRQAAIEAESRRQWQDALDLYEQIRQLPADVHPTDLESRINRVKGRLGR